MFYLHFSNAKQFVVVDVSTILETIFKPYLSFACIRDWQAIAKLAGSSDKLLAWLEYG